MLSLPSLWGPFPTPFWRLPRWSRGLHRHHDHHHRLHRLQRLHQRLHDHIYPLIIASIILWQKNDVFCFKLFPNDLLHLYVMFELSLAAALFICIFDCSSLCAARVVHICRCAIVVLATIHFACLARDFHRPRVSPRDGFI